MRRSLLFTVLSLLLVMCLMLCACSKGGNETTEPSSTSPHESEQSYTAAILQFDNDSASVTMRQSFIARMRTLGYDEAKMKFDILSSHGEAEKLSQNVQSLIGSEYSLIVAVGTLAAKSVAESNNSIPCVFIGAEDPVTGGIVTSPDAPEGNITGTAFRTSAETLLSVMRVYTPDISTVAAVYNADCAFAKTDVETVKDILTENAYTVNMASIKQGEELAGKITALCQNSDALYIPNDNFTQDEIEMIMNTANNSDTVVFTSSESFIEAGALMGAFTGADALAGEAALTADRIMQGETVSSIPVNAEVGISLFVNRAALEKYGVETPTSDNLVLV